MQRFRLTHLLLVLILACPAVARAEAPATQPAGLAAEPAAMTILHLTDPQFGMATKDKDFAAETASFTRAIAAANELKPAFVVITGDLVNKTGDAAQIAEFQRIRGQLDKSIPLHLVAGNHDVANVPTPATLEAYRKTFGPDWYSFDQANRHFVVLDSTVFHQPKNVPDDAVKQMAFLKEDLAAARKMSPIQIVVMMHHPLFLAKVDEGDAYGALPRPVRKELLDLFKANDVKLVLTGHEHANILHQYEGIELVTTGPVGPAMHGDVSGYRVVELFGDHIESKYIPLKPATTRPAASIRE